LVAAVEDNENSWLQVGVDEAPYKPPLLMTFPVPVLVMGQRLGLLELVAAVGLPEDQSVVELGQDQMVGFGLANERPALGRATLPEPAQFSQVQKFQSWTFLAQAGIRRLERP
jgi:hypothetical protein